MSCRRCHRLSVRRDDPRCVRGGVNVQSAPVGRFWLLYHWFSSSSIGTIMLSTYITFVFAMFIFRCINILSSDSNCSIFGHYCDVSVHKNVPSAKRRLFGNDSSCSLVLPWTEALGEMVSPVLLLFGSWSPPLSNALQYCREQKPWVRWCPPSYSSLDPDLLILSNALHYCREQQPWVRWCPPSYSSLDPDLLILSSALHYCREPQLWVRWCPPS